MEKLRTSEIRRLELQIKDIEASRRHAEETIQRLRASTIGDNNFMTKTLGKNKEIINSSAGGIEEIENKIKAVQQGELDDSLREQVKNTTDKFIKDNEEKEKEKKTKALQNKILKEQSWARNKEVYSEDRKTRDYQKQYQYMLKVANGLPDYLRVNLMKMPNNKGYIYRGVWFMGYLYEERGQPTLMFEKKGRANLIHEYRKDVYMLWERDGKSKKLISRTARRQI